MATKQTCNSESCSDCINDTHSVPFAKCSYVIKLVEEEVKRISDLRIQDKASIEVIRDADLRRIDDLRTEVVTRLNQSLSDHKAFNEAINKAQLESMGRLGGEREQRLAQKFDSLDRAIEKAEAANEKRFEGVNEFRNTLRDQQSTFMTRHEFDTAHKSLQDMVNANSKTQGDIILSQKERIDKLEALKQGGQNVWVLIVGVVAIATSLISFVLGLFGK